MKKVSNIRDTVNNCHIALHGVMKRWLVDEDKEDMLRYYNTLAPFEKDAVIGALKNVISQSKDPDFRRSAKDIPEYIKANS